MDVEIFELEARFGQGGLGLSFNFGLIAAGRAIGERIGSQVAGQPDP